MWRISERARELIEALLRRSFPGEVVSIELARRAPVVEALAQLREPGVLPVIAELALKHPDSHTLRGALRRLLSDLDAAARIELDRRVRVLSEWNDALWAVSVKDVRSLADPALLGLLTQSRDGYVRAAALARIASGPADFLWPFVVLRLNDWVPAIREQAAALAQSLLPRVSPETLVSMLPLADRLANAGRAQAGPFLERLDARLATPEGLAALERGLEALPPLTRRAAFLRLLSRPELSLAWLERAAQSGDPVVALEAAARCRQVLRGEALEALLGRLTQGKLPRVRREAYFGYATALPELAKEKLFAALLDPSPIVRELARLRLQETDLAELYRRALDGDPPPPGALLGLGEVGTKADLERLRPFFRHGPLRLRKAALRAAITLDAQAVEAELREAFAGASPALTYLAGAGLARLGARLDPSWLARWLEPGAAPHQARAAWRLLGALDRWDALPLIVGGLASADEALRRRAQVALGRWLTELNRRQVQPRPAQLAALRKVLAETELPARTRAELEHLLRAYA